MANYAFLDENNIVTEVISGIDETELIEGLEPEVWYGNFRGQVCKRTSYNTRRNIHLANKEPFRGNYASIGYTYNTELDAFIPPKPFESWLFDNSILDWEAPTTYPDDGVMYKWNEETTDWVAVVWESDTPAVES
jgi:hypothetical protein